MTNYKNGCFIQQTDELLQFETAMAISARTNVDILKPSEVNLDSLESDLISLISSSGSDYGQNEIGGETSRKITDDNINPNQFWKIQEWAFNKLYKYEACKYNAMILKEDFINFMNAGCNIVTRYKLDPENDKTPIRIVTVVGFDGSNVQFMNPMLDEPEDSNRFMSLDDFWYHTDLGGDLHIGIVFSNINNKFSPEYKLDDYEYPEELYPLDELDSYIVNEKTVAKNKSDFLREESIVLATAGADSLTVSDANMDAEDYKLAMIMSDIYREKAFNYVKECLYPDHPTGALEA